MGKASIVTLFVHVSITYTVTYSLCLFSLLYPRAFTTGNPPAPRYHHSAVVHEKSMFVFGELALPLPSFRFLV